ncbi:MAG: hypothetical protein AAB317_01185 [Nitrospirota bacterium]
MGSPIVTAILFSAIGLWILFAMLPGLRRPPPGLLKRCCPACGHVSKSGAKRCEKCDAAL